MEATKEKFREKSHKREENLVLRINKDNKIVKCNNNFEKTFGYCKEELIDEYFFEKLISERYLGHWNKIINKEIANFSVSDFKLPVITKNGHEIMVSWSSFPIKNKDGQVEDIDFVGTLITSWNDSKDASPVESKEDNKNQMVWKEVDTADLNDTEVSSGNERDSSAIVSKYNLLKDENAYLKKYIKKIRDNGTNYPSSKKDLFSKSAYRFSDIVGGKKRREEFNAVKNEIDAREEYLDNLQSRIKKDKKDINKQKADLVKWREKLESLESDIQSRKKWVETKERAIKKFYSFEEKKSSHYNKQEDEDFQSNMIDKIKDSAAIVQRGVFKYVNSSFADLLGYNTSEIINKSLFDFIVSDGFSSIENYYLNRLKGDSVSSIDTIFLTKNSNKINVQVSTKPTFYKGEKADLFVIKKMSDETTEFNQKDFDLEEDEDKSQSEMIEVDKEIKDESEDKNLKKN